MGKTSAEIAPDIEARPIVNRRRIGDRRNRGRPPLWRQVGGLRGKNTNHCAGGQADAADECTRIHGNLQPLSPTRDPPPALAPSQVAPFTRPDSWTMLLDKAWSSDGWKMTRGPTSN